MITFDYIRNMNKYNYFSCLEIDSNNFECKKFETFYKAYNHNLLNKNKYLLCDRSNTFRLSKFIPYWFEPFFIKLKIMNINVNIQKEYDNLNLPKEIM